MNFSVSELNNILGKLKFKDFIGNNLLFNQVNIDTRKLMPGDLFLALVGKKYDGHNFLGEAIKKGAMALVINEGKERLVPNGIPYWTVNDTLEAFQKLALFQRNKLNIPVVAITGSVGKTTTKEMSGEVLKKLGKIKLSYENFNNEIGVSLTILDTDISDKLLVLEMGMRGLGQIENLSKYAEPDIAIITNIGSSHIGILGTRENISKAKCEITKYLNPNGLIIIPNGDSLLERSLKEVWKGRIIRVQILNIEQLGKTQEVTDNLIIGFYDDNNNLIKIENKVFEISFKGIHNASNFLFVYALSKEFGINFKDYNKFEFPSLDGRNKIIKTNKVTIMDETYNASPESVKACVDLLKRYKKGKHFVILGSMKELGIRSEDFHKEIFNYIIKKNVQGFIFICDSYEEKSLKTKYFIENKIYFVKDINEVIKRINKLTHKGDFILIKGSRYWQLEKIIPFID